MRRNGMASVLAMLGAAVVATSASGLALSHGIAHLHAAEHEREHAQDHGAHHAAAGERTASAMVEKTDHGEHQHLDSPAAVTVRASAAPFVVAAEVALALGVDVSAAGSNPRAAPADVPDGPPRDRAAQPRAPPLG